MSNIGTYSKAELIENLLKTPLIHYGAKKYDPEKFSPIKNQHFDKPLGGLWTSPINSIYGWKEFSTSRDVKPCVVSFKINLKPSTRVYIIDTTEDLEKSPYYELGTEHFTMKFIDFEKLKEEYDVIWLTYKGLHITRNIKSIFSLNIMSWDCESVIIMNEECIVGHETPKAPPKELTKSDLDEIDFLIIEGLAIHENQTHIVAYLEERNINLSLSSIEKRINKMKKIYKVQSMFQLGFEIAHFGKPYEQQ